MKKELKAIKFYESIKEKKELNKYKLVNGLFIVKYINKDICVYVGDFLRVGSVGNYTKKNLVLLTKNPNPTKFNPKSKRATTSLGYWTKLNIGFREKPISEILR